MKDWWWECCGLEGGVAGWGRIPSGRLMVFEVFEVSWGALFWLYV